MLLRSLLVLSSIAPLCIAQLSWKTPGVCISPTGTLCRTLVYEESGWANRSWGFHAVDRYTDRITEAVRSDGAALLRIAHRSFKFYLISSESFDRSRVILHLERRTVEIEHSVKEVRDMGGVWSFNEFWSDTRIDDENCSGRATMVGEKWRRTGKEPVVGGIRGIEYVYATPDNRIEQRIAFAPSLGCTAVAFSLSTRSSAGMPVSEQRLRLVTATLAEPDQALFAIPKEYRLTGPARSWPYICMDKFPGDITGSAFSKVVP